MKDFTARCMTWAQKMKTAGDEDVANLLLRAEQEQRKAPRRRKKHTQLLYSERGERIVLYREDVKRLSE